MLSLVEMLTITIFINSGTHGESSCLKGSRPGLKITSPSDLTCHAWGSAPLYDFLAEVAGVKPERPGWEVIAFQPRVDLFPNLDAKVPFKKGVEIAIAHVSWRTQAERTNIYLSLRNGDGEYLDMHVIARLPNGDTRMIRGKEDIILEMC
ncbi:hypothetical protein ACHAP3_008860 [Botrytis cinerea]